ncbi:MAG TPA: CopG family transcriptional regulator [Chloroflexota bacterium]|nr:CopG family transcriptional regulator [Chloroflexota bacterium]
MKRLQIYIDEEMDEELGLRAARQGTSKAALIRDFVAERLSHGTGPRSADPLDAIVGIDDGEPASVDDVVYGVVEEPPRRGKRR